MKELIWEPLNDLNLPAPYNSDSPKIIGIYNTRRAKVPGGWLVAFNTDDHVSGLTFYPDPSYSWDGGSLP
jgi:hypothetical protein